MKKKIIILLIALVLLTIIPVSAEYQPSIEKKAFGFYSIDSVISWSYSNSIIVAIYESSEHRNQLIEEQNHILWIQTCYRPMSNYAGQGNLSAWKKECADAGYPVQQ